MFLTDTFLLDKTNVISEDKARGVMKVRGVFQRADEENDNKRIYPKKLLEAQMKKIQPLIKERRLVGELDHPTNDTVKLANASHLITNIYFKGKDMIGEAEILNTPQGKTAQALIDGGVKIGISSRGNGSLTEQDDGPSIVNEDFNLVTFDLVSDPSTQGAYPSLYESKQTASKDVVKQELKKNISERAFIIMLKGKLYEK